MQQSLVQDGRKLRGGYYTPTEICECLAEWAIQNPNDRVLEPSCGDGAFLRAAVQRLRVLGANPTTVAKAVHAVELFPEELALARESLRQLGVHSNGQLIEGDFFSAKRGQLAGTPFDVILGNPPFLRYQNFPGEQRDLAFGLMKESGLKPNKLTNAWVPFLTVSAASLGDTGRLAMVIPAELLQVNYAAQTREFLANTFRAIWIITFRQLVFHGIQQEVVLVLAEKGGIGPKGIRVMEADTITDVRGMVGSLSQATPLSINHAEEKWTKYFLSQVEIDLMRTIRESAAVPRLKDFASVDVGVVTGQNSFFVLQPSEVSRLGLDEYAVPVIGRTYQLSGLKLTQELLEANFAANHPCKLLAFPSVSASELSLAARRYIESGEAQSVHLGYKCSIRKQWFSVPSVWTPDAFLFRQIHQYPKMVVNLTNATSTDTIHRVRIRSLRSASWVVTAGLNSLTLAFAEIMGRSYGGGVLELEPNEAEALPFPSLPNGAAPLLEVQRLESEGKVDAALDWVDEWVLHGHMGMDWKDISRFRSVWRKLSQRRIERKSKAKGLS